MTDEMKPPRESDRMYIKSWHIFGKEFYRVQITKYLHRPDPEPDDKNAGRPGREATLQKKFDRLDAVIRSVQQLVDTGGVLNPVVVRELVSATNDFWEAHGHGPLFVPNKDNSEGYRVSS
jgi:hypothetical protein